MTITPVIKEGPRGRPSTADGPQPNIFNTPSNNHGEIFMDNVEDQGIAPLPNVPSQSDVDRCFDIRIATLNTERVKVCRV
jgi:hypothetical protein